MLWRLRTGRIAPSAGNCSPRKSPACFEDNLILRCPYLTLLSKCLRYETVRRLLALFVVATWDRRARITHLARRTRCVCIGRQRTERIRHVLPVLASHEQCSPGGRSTRAKLLGYRWGTGARVIPPICP